MTTGSGELDLSGVGDEGELNTLAALASGRVDPALTLLIGSAMELRGAPPLTGDAFSGAALEMEAPAEMSRDALSLAFDAISALEAEEAPQRQRRPAVRPDPELIRLPAALQEHVSHAERTRGWSGVAPGIRSLVLELPGAAKAEILRIDAGVATPRHGHGGREYTLCLSGGFSDGRGSYGPGDISVADEHVTHRPQADADGACYVLAVTDADLRLTGMLGALQRLLNG